MRVQYVCLFTENVRDLCHIQMVGTFSCTTYILCAKREKIFVNIENGNEKAPT